VSLDLDEIRERAVPVSQGAYRCVREEDFNALVAEVEHLREERAAVVAWLRDEMHHGWEADAIERGEHRREEDP